MRRWFERAINSDAKVFSGIKEFDIDAVILMCQRTSGSRTYRDVVILVFVQREVPRQSLVPCKLKVTLEVLKVRSCINQISVISKQIQVYLKKIREVIHID